MIAIRKPSCFKLRVPVAIRPFPESSKLVFTTFGSIEGFRRFRYLIRAVFYMILVLSPSDIGI